MLSRRHLRIKVLHALYEHFQNPGIGVNQGLRKLNENIESIYELYLYELKALTDILRIAEDEMERRKNKRLPTEEDLNPSPNFVENRFLNWLGNNEDFGKKVERYKVRWGDDREVLRRIFKEFSKSAEYEEYLQLESPSLKDDKQIVKFLYGVFIVNNEHIHHLYEEKDLHWADDLDAAQMIVAKTIKRYDEKTSANAPLPRLIKDADDLEFAEILYTKTLKNGEAYEEMIHDKAQHWETDRIALIDIILMKLAIAELISFKEIPVKVTLNEYIELSKEYSTPKSGNFINGILDKLKQELMDKGEIRKIGRGLL